MKYIRDRLVILILLFLMLFCSGVSAGQQHLKIGIYPSNAPEKLAPPMQILAEHLSRNSSISFTSVITKDYPQLSERLGNGTIDIAWINPVNYVKLKSEIPDLQYIATYMEKNEETGEIFPYYHSCILSLKTSGITDLKGLKGEIFAFTDRGSTSGYAYPAMLLRKRGIDPTNYFAKVFFLKQHDRVIEALRSGSIDGGAVSDGAYFSAVKKYGDLFTVLEKSEPIPLDAIVAAKHVSSGTVHLVQQLLIHITLEHPFNQAMKQYLGWNAAGFEVRDDSFYNPLREALVR